MQVAVLASGSKGNATFIELDGKKLLIDAGISARALIGAQTADGLKVLFGAKTDDNGVLRDVAVIPKMQGDIISCDDIRAAFIGNINDIVTRIHVKKITSKGITDAITIPPNAGTMARLEDLTGDKIYITFAGQEDTVQNAINTLKTDQGGLGEQVSTIESKIPADASETNPLVTKNEILALPTFTYKVVTELPKTGEENIIYLVPKAGEGNDVHDEYIWVNSAYELIGTTAVDLSGYLPLTGGTMTGTLASNVPDYTKSIDLPGFSVQRSGGSVVMAIGSSLELNSGGVNDLSPYLSDTATLGNESIKWKNVYTTKLNNGADIAVPADGGTLARIEDINAIGGVGTAGQVLTKTENGMAWQDATGGSSLPDQTGNAGKFLTTDGTTASWGNALASTAKSNSSLCIGGNDTTYGQPFSVWIGFNSGPENDFASNSLAVGNYAKAGSTAVALGGDASAKNAGISIGYNAVSTYNAIQLGSGTNNDENTFKVANSNGNFEMMDANGNVPLERLTYVTNQIGDISTALTAILGE